MKTFQHLLRVLVIAGSLGGFFSGWALFAHSGKPVDAASAPAMDNIPTQLPPLNFDKPSTLQPLPQLPPASSFTMPRLRTRGS